MGSIVGQAHHPDENPSIPAPLDGIVGGEGIRPLPDLPFEDREPALVGYQPDLTGKIEGDQSVS